MKDNWWIQFRGAGKISSFALLTLAAIVFVAFLPARDWAGHSISGRPGLPLPIILLASWIGGWFLKLFVRVQNLDVLSPFDHRRTSRLVGLGLISVGAVFAAILSVSLFK